MQPSCVHFSVASRENLDVVIPGLAPDPPAREPGIGSDPEKPIPGSAAMEPRRPRNDNMKFSVGRHANSATDSQ
jgi:hypothetical protein